MVISEMSTGLTFFHLHRQWSRFLKYLRDFDPAVTTGGFIRLLVMVIVQMTAGLVFTSLLLYRQVGFGYYTYRGWADIHSNFSRIDLVPTAFLTKENYFWLIFSWWMPVVAALTVFVIYSFTKEVTQDYKAGFTWLLEVVLRRPAQTDNPKPVLSKMYVYITQCLVRRVSSHYSPARLNAVKAPSSV
jgi:pheromone a factor receptor